jgi:hypothetical protein
LLDSDAYYLKNRDEQIFFIDLGLIMHLFLGFLLLFSPLLNSEASSEITRVTGQVQVIYGNDPTPRRVTEKHIPSSGQIFQTPQGGLLTLSLHDGTLITMAGQTIITLMDILPESKPIILLHEGRLRITRPSESVIDFFLVTPQSVMKTQRGDFHAVFAKPTQHTSIVVYHDEVLLTPKLNRLSVLKKALEDYANYISTPEVKRTRDGEVEITTQATEESTRQVNILLAQLHRPETVTVGVGHFSSYYFDTPYPVTPQRISPAQFNLLITNRDFSRNDNEADFLDRQSLGVAPSVPYAKSPARPEGEVNRRLRMIAPKAGGLIDLRTGHYIEPGEDAEFYQPALVYLPNIQDGQLGRTTGVYYPTEELELQAEGFTGLGSSRLNSKLAINLYKYAGDRYSRLRGSLSQREALTKNLLSFRLSPHVQTLTVQSNQSTQEYKTSLSERYDISLAHLSGTRWQMENNLRLKRLNFSKTTPSLAVGTLDSSKKWLYGFDMGVRFYLRSRLSIVTTLGIEQNHFVETLPAESSFSSRLTPINSAKWVGAFEWKIAKTGSLDLDSVWALFYHFNKKTRSLKTEASFGLRTDLKLSYWVNTKWRVEFGGWFETISQDAFQNAVISSVKRESLGSIIGLTYIY